MIKDILLPEKIGSYYLFKKRIIGFDINKSHISACEVLVSGTTYTIEQCKEYSIESNDEETYQERAAKTIQAVCADFKKYDAINISLSSAVVVFKELKLPFTSYEKIKMVVGFEVEPLLPFSLHDAVIDFIITKTNQEEKTSEILVAAIPKQHVLEKIQLFEQAGIPLDVITVDLIAVYGVYQQLPMYQDVKGGVALIDLGVNTTRIAYIYNGQLRSIRALSDSISTIARTLAQTMNIPVAKALEQLHRIGFANGVSDEYKKALEKAGKEYLDKLSLALTSFSVYHTDDIGTEKILLFGQGADLKNITSYLSEGLHVPCTLLNGTQIAQVPNILIKTPESIKCSDLLSMSAALPVAITDRFNLYSQDLKPPNELLLLKQLITGAIFTLFLLGGFWTYNFWQSRILRAELESSEMEAVKVLKRRFKSISKDKEELEEVVKLAKREVAREQEWFAFSKTSRAKFLEYLLELTNKIDKEALGFEAEAISISEGMITLKARVKDHEALKLLERALRSSDLFSSIEPQNDPQFTMKITLAHSIGEDT